MRLAVKHTDRLIPDLPRDHPESYHSFMFENFFRHIDIDPVNVTPPFLISFLSVFSRFTFSTETRLHTRKSVRTTRRRSSKPAESICSSEESDPTDTLHSTNRAVLWPVGHASRRSMRTLSRYSNRGHSNIHMFLAGQCSFLRRRSVESADSSSHSWS